MATDDLPAVRVPGEAVPPPRVWSDRNPPADRRLKLARAALAEVAELLSLPVENLLTPDTLRRVAWTPPEPLTLGTLQEALRDLDARPWQIDATAQVILNAFVDADQTVGMASDGDS
jgi:ribonuclease D